jgi:hypothetical protein
MARGTSGASEATCRSRFDRRDRFDNLGRPKESVIATAIFCECMQESTRPSPGQQSMPQLSTRPILTFDPSQPRSPGSERTQLRLPSEPNRDRRANPTATAERTQPRPPSEPNRVCRANPTAWALRVLSSEPMRATLITTWVRDNPRRSKACPIRFGSPHFTEGGGSRDGSNPSRKRERTQTLPRPGVRTKPPLATKRTHRIRDPRSLPWRSRPG